MRLTLKNDTPQKVAERYKAGGFGTVGTSGAKRKRRIYMRNLRADNLPDTLLKAYKKTIQNNSPKISGSIKKGVDNG